MSTLTNKAAEELRQQIADFLSANLATISTDFKQLHPRYRVKLYCAMLQYELPRLRAVKSGIDFAQMTEVQLDRIIKELRESLIGEEKVRPDEY